MDKNEIKILQQDCAIIEVAIELGIKIRNNIGECFCYSKHPGSDRFTLFFNPASNTFFCRFCKNIGGDVIDLVCQYKGWNRQRAIEWLIHRRNFDLKTRAKYYNRGQKR